MSGYKGATFCDDLLKLFFNATAIANIADNAATSPLTNLYVSLHTADPTAAGNQTSNEATYGAYARQAVVRTSSGFTVSTNTVDFAADVTFPTSTGTPSESYTWMAIGTLVSGTGKILYAGPLSATITMNAAGITPKILASGSQGTET